MSRLEAGPRTVAGARAAESGPGRAGAAPRPRRLGTPLGVGLPLSPGGAGGAALVVRSAAVESRSLTFRPEPSRARAVLARAIVPEAAGAEAAGARTVLARAIGPEAAGARTIAAEPARARTARPEPSRARRTEPGAAGATRRLGSAGPACRTRSERSLATRPSVWDRAF